MFIFGRLPKSNFISMHFISYKWFQLFQSTVSELRRPKSCGITAPVRRWFNSLLTSFLIFCMVSSRTIFPFQDWKLVKRNHFPLHFENRLSNLCSKMAFLSELAIVSSSSSSWQCLLWKLTYKSIHNANFRTTLCISCQTFPHLPNHPSPMTAWVTNTTIGYPEFRQSSLTSWSKYKLLGIKGSY